MSTAIERPSNKFNHIVLLGAGASKACLPDGDRNGNIVPLMNELDKIPAISKFLFENKIDKGQLNFEELYSNMYRTNPDSSNLKALNDLIFNYFKTLELPDNPTLYDYLILSLKENDTIATFNWDPFLVQAYRRVIKITNKLPKLLFLHGSVALGICNEHLIIDLLGNKCIKCRKPLEKLPLLYPTSQKDYSSIEYIKEQWDELKSKMTTAFGMTIFGYAAPKSDSAAIDLLHKAWGGNQKRVMEEIDIINIETDSVLRKTWDEFIHSHHYSIYKDYFESSIARYPRRISEYQFQRFNLNLWVDGHSLKKGLCFSELRKKIQELVIHE